MNAGVEERGGLVDGSQGNEIRDTGEGICVSFQVPAKKRDIHIERGSPSVSLETVGSKQEWVRWVGCQREMTRLHTGLRSKDL